MLSKTCSPSFSDSAHKPGIGYGTYIGNPTYRHYTLDISKSVMPTVVKKTSIKPIRSSFLTAMIDCDGVKPMYCEQLR